MTCKLWILFAKPENCAKSTLKLENWRKYTSKNFQNIKTGRGDYKNRENSGKVLVAKKKCLEKSKKMLLANRKLKLVLRNADNMHQMNFEGLQDELRAPLKNEKRSSPVRLPQENRQKLPHGMKPLLQELLKSVI